MERMTEKPVTSRRAETFYLGLLAVGWLASQAIGLAGIDFGPHWDEPNTIDEVIRAVRTGVLLPR